MSARLRAVERTTLIVLAAGSGERLGLEVPKAFAPLAGRPMVARTLAAALECRAIGKVVLVAPAGWEDRAHELAGASASVVTGGPTRQASVRAALAAVEPDADAIVCHDAARPLASPALFAAVLDSLESWDGVVPVIPATDTLKRVREGRVEGTEARESIAFAQTPQAFVASALRDAHARAERDGIEVTDDAAALEAAGYRVRAIDGEPWNFKVTTAEDLARAEAVVAELARG